MNTQKRRLSKRGAVTNSLVIKHSIPHPGLLLKKEIVWLKVSQKETARCMGVQPNLLSDIIRGRRNLSVSIALRLEKTLGLDAEHLMIEQLRYDLACSRIDPFCKKVMHKARRVNAKKMN